MATIHYLTADQDSLSGRRCELSRGARTAQVCLFSEQDLIARVPNARSEARSKARGVLWLSWLLRELSRERELHPDTGCYLTFAPGPVHEPLRALLQEAGDQERLAILEKSLPPKDYFLANPAMKAAQISIEFQFHGPWMCFPSLARGLHDGYRYAGLDLRCGQVPAALVGGFFALDDERHLDGLGGSSLCECAFLQYAISAEELLPCPVVDGKYGPFSGLLASFGVH